MQVVQQHGITVPDPRYEAEFFEVPAKRIQEKYRPFLGHLFHLVDALKVELLSVSPPSSPSFLPHVLAAMIAGESNKDAALQYLKNIRTGSKGKASIPPELVQFSYSLAFKALVRRLPESPCSLADLTKMGTSIQTGATIGLVAANGIPLVMITVPIGVILCGATKVAHPVLCSKFLELIEEPNDKLQILSLIHYRTRIH